MLKLRPMSVKAETIARRARFFTLDRKWYALLTDELILSTSEQGFFVFAEPSLNLPALAVEVSDNMLPPDVDYRMAIAISTVSERIANT